MATTIVTKYGGDAPAASDIVRGELAVDTENGRLYTENAAGAVVEIGLNPEGNVDVTGTVTADGLTVQTTNGLNVLLESSNSYQYLQFKNTGETNNFIGFINDDFVVSPANTQKLILTAEGNVGIGANNPDSLLHLKNTGSDVRLTLETGESYDCYINFSGATSEASIGYDATDNALLFCNPAGDLTSGEAMRIDSSGNVGIGTASPQKTLDVKGTFAISNSTTSYWDFDRDDSDGSLKIADTGTERMRIDASGNVTIKASGADASRTLSIQGTNGSSQAYQFNIVADGENSAAKFMVGSGGGAASEVMRISGGNLLVGTTDTDPSNNGAGGDAGHAFSSTGYISSARSGDTVALFNRMDSDGNIVSFRKDGTAVGSIGTGAGAFGIGQGTGNLGFFDAFVVPMGNTAGGASDGDITLGNGGRRFKDLYLSGGAYLGGTAAANKLDDYEEGLWTLTITTSGTGESVSIGNTTGTYTKIGRQVTATIYTSGVNVSAAGSGAIYLGGLPFTAGNGNEFYAVPSFGHTTLFSYQPDGYVAVNTNYIAVTRVGTTTPNDLAVGNPKHMIMTVTYFTA